MISVTHGVLVTGVGMWNFVQYVLASARHVCCGCLPCFVHHDVKA